MTGTFMMRNLDIIFNKLKFNVQWLFINRKHFIIVTNGNEKLRLMNFFAVKKKSLWCESNLIRFDKNKTMIFVNAMKVVTSITKWQDDYSDLRQWSSNMKLIVVANSVKHKENKWLRRIFDKFHDFLRIITGCKRMHLIWNLW